MTTIALGIPHTPWVEARAKSMDRLMRQLSDRPGWGPYELRTFTDREPNWSWSLKLWRWAYETGADWCLQLQDDVEVAPCFWPALRAMLGALPSEAGIVGLSVTHPMAIEIARQGHRWFKTPSMLIGWAYAIRRDMLGAFLETRIDGAEPPCEDVELGRFAFEHGGVWHPCPTLCDHDTSIPSSYDNDHHATRRPPVTWRSYGEGDMCSKEWWAPPQIVQMLPMPAQRECWFCMERPIVGGSARTGAGICGVCLGALWGEILQGQVHGRRG